ncbi:hypothetical protein MMC21_001773 [Puttea exsequens]|nr:hypothetical protein [Puttea exsequens]
MDKLEGAQLVTGDHAQPAVGAVQEVDRYERPKPRKQKDSIMRAFLESGEEWVWPPELGDITGIHCDLKPHLPGIPLTWKKPISSINAEIDMYEPSPEYNYSFQKPFVVKVIRKDRTTRAQQEAANEVNTMKDLRHPHVSALLATFLFQARTHIVIYPAACCNLFQFTKRMSKDIQSLQPKDHTASIHSQVSDLSEGTVSPDSYTSSSQERSGPETSEAQKVSKPIQTEESDVWPLNISLQLKVNFLRRYFVCLSEALAYLHESGVRHKDIKPENILIDESGSVLLTDFGISRRFAKNKSHVTSNEWNFTRKYASPEIMKSKTAERDDPSDVFSLGCVFLEMATLLLGRTLKEFSDYYTTVLNDTAREKAYYCNLGNIHSWIENLRKIYTTSLEATRSSAANEAAGEIFTVDPTDTLVEALVHIREMLDENPRARPKSTDLWRSFESVSPQACRDCHPVDGTWKPSERQRKDRQTGLQKRRSLIPEEKEGIDDFGAAHQRDNRLLPVPQYPDGPNSRLHTGAAFNDSIQNLERSTNSRLVFRPTSPVGQNSSIDIRHAQTASRSSSPLFYRNQPQQEAVNSNQTIPSFSRHPIPSTPLRTTQEPVSSNVKGLSSDAERTIKPITSRASSPHFAKHDVSQVLGSRDRLPSHPDQVPAHNLTAIGRSGISDSRIGSQELPINAQVISYDFRHMRPYMTSLGVLLSITLPIAM